MVHTRFSPRNQKGISERVFSVLAGDADNEYTMIDSTIVRAPQHSAGAKGGDKHEEAIGRRLGGLSTNIHPTENTLS